LNIIEVTLCKAKGKNSYDQMTTLDKVLRQKAIENVYVRDARRLLQDT